LLSHHHARSTSNILLSAGWKIVCAKLFLSIPKGRPDREQGAAIFREFIGTQSH
jgi:hypothetical protein